jgi:SAM-dependent methyltransferase
MTHVNYDEWARYIAGLITLHSPGEIAANGAGRRRIMELGCGTGSIGLALCSSGDYAYTGLDRSAEMLTEARRKADALGIDGEWINDDFCDFTIGEPVDTVLLLYDGLNYAITEEQIRALFAAVARALRPGGLFLVDQSTPANSENNGEAFEDQGGDEMFRYQRLSHYDANERIHRTVFRISRLGTVYEEEHVQRAYSAEEIAPLLRGAGLEILAAYDGFSTKPVSGISERIQWVARKPRMIEGARELPM